MSRTPLVLIGCALVNGALAIGQYHLGHPVYVAISVVLVVISVGLLALHRWVHRP